MANRFVAVATAVETALNAHTWVADTPDQIARKYRPEIDRAEKALSIFISPATSTGDRLARNATDSATVEIDVMVTKPIDGNFTTTQIDDLLTFVEEVNDAIEEYDFAPHAWLSYSADLANAEELDDGMFVTVTTYTFSLLD